MNDPFFAVDGGDASFATFVATAGDDHFVVLADWDRFDLSRISHAQSQLEKGLGENAEGERERGREE